MNSEVGRELRYAISNFIDARNETQNLLNGLRNATNIPESFRIRDIQEATQKIAMLTDAIRDYRIELIDYQLEQDNLFNDEKDTYVEDNVEIEHDDTVLPTIQEHRENVYEQWYNSVTNPQPERPSSSLD